MPDLQLPRRVIVWVESAHFLDETLDSSSVARTVAQMKVAIFSGQESAVRVSWIFWSDVRAKRWGSEGDSESVRFSSPLGICSFPFWHIKILWIEKCMSWFLNNKNDPSAGLKSHHVMWYTDTPKVMFRGFICIERMTLQRIRRCPP